MHHMLVACNFLDENKLICAHGKHCYLNDVLKPTANSTGGSDGGNNRILCHRSQISATDSVYGCPNFFITCAIDKHVKMWDIRMRSAGMDYKLASELNGVKSCRLQPNIFAVCHEKTINVFDIRTSKPLVTFDAFLNYSELISLEMSNSGGIVFASDDKGTLAGYDIMKVKHQQSNGSLCATDDYSTDCAVQLMSFMDDRLCMQMSNDGQSMVVGSNTGDIYLTQMIH